MVFHEITPQAIQRAVEECRTIDAHLVEAQEARRIFDRIYGFKLSDVMRRKTNGRSAGRVQSVATRMVVDRERERMAFRSAGWWGIDATVDRRGRGRPCRRGRRRPRVHRVAAGRRRDGPGQRQGLRPLGALTAPGQVVVLDEAAARALAAGLDGAPFTVSSMTHKPYRRSPAPPFMTSTLQQEAGRKLRFSSKRTMQVAQRLYEEGWITYMRTDSTTLSDQALDAARAQAAATVRAGLRAGPPRRYERRSRTPRRPTRPSARPARPSAPRTRPPGRCRATSSGSTT